MKVIVTMLVVVMFCLTGCRTPVHPWTEWEPSEIGLWMKEISAIKAEAVAPAEFAEMLEARMEEEHGEKIKVIGLTSRGC